MTLLVTALCGSCGRPIVWTVTENGERMPCDAHPAVGGNIRILPPASPGNTPRAVVTPAGMIDLFDPTDDGTRYIAHFVTCPDADSWRKVS